MNIQRAQVAPLDKFLVLRLYLLVVRGVCVRKFKRAREKKSEDAFQFWFSRGEWKNRSRRQSSVFRARRPPCPYIIDLQRAVYAPRAGSRRPVD